MSFLTDFRSAEYELIRMKRAAELERSRRKRTQPAALGDEEPSAQPDYPPTVSPEGQIWAPPTTLPEDQVWAPPATDHYPVSDSDVLVAASETEEPGGKRRLGLGLPSFRNLGQSPATA